MPCDVRTARGLTTADPQHDIPKMTGEETVHECMHSGQSCHRIVENLFVFVGTRNAHLINGRSLCTAFRLNVLMLVLDCWLDRIMLVLDCCLDQTCMLLLD